MGHIENTERAENHIFMHDGMIRDKQYGIENDGLVIFRKLGFSFSRTERDFVAVPQVRKKHLIGGRSLGCPGVIEVYIAGPHWQKPRPISKQFFAHFF
jgi:hypothetical protein